VGDIDTAVVDSLKVLDLKWPIREADITAAMMRVGDVQRRVGPVEFLCANNQGVIPTHAAPYANSITTQRYGWFLESPFSKAQRGQAIP
jgi:hypothetical protein